MSFQSVPMSQTGMIPTEHNVEDCLVLPKVSRESVFLAALNGLCSQVPLPALSADGACRGTALELIQTAAVIADIASSEYLEPLHATADAC